MGLLGALGSTWAHRMDPN